MAQFATISREEIVNPAANGIAHTEEPTEATPAEATPTVDRPIGWDAVEYACAVTWEFVIRMAEVSRDEAKKHAVSLGIVTKDFSAGWTRLLNQQKALTTSTRDDGSIVYQLKRNLQHMSYEEYVEMLNGLYAPKEPKEKYADWYAVSGTLVLTGDCLASCPVEGQQAMRAFPRSVGDTFILQSGNFWSMMNTAAGMPGSPPIKGARYQIRWFQQVLPTSMLKKVLRPVPPSRPGAAGQGITEVECIPPGSRIPFKAIVPGSHVDPEAFQKLMQVAADLVGFSPSASHKGWGRFTVEYDK